MKRIATPLLLSLLGCTPASHGPPSRVPPTADTAIGRDESAAADLDELVEDFLLGNFEFDPVGATSAGLHEHDGRWPDLSPEGRARSSEWTRRMRERVDTIDGAELDVDRRLELDIVRDQLELARFSEEVEQPWTRNPLAYSGLISTGIDDLISRDFAPLDQRAASLAARLEALPLLVEQARANLAEPSALLAPQTEVAIAQLPGLVGLIEREVPKKTEAADPALRERIAVATPKAVAAIDGLRTQLQNALPSASQAWRLGPESFARKLALTLQTSIGAQELVDLAKAEHERVRADMLALATELYLAMWGEADLSKQRAKGLGDLELIRKVIVELAADHPTPAGLRDAAEANLARLDGFVRTEQLVPVDDAERLQVIWTPEHARGVAIAGLAAPAQLDAATPGLPSFYLVQPIPEKWSPALTESFLREYNTFMLEILSIHEAIPGHFVQLYWGKREPSRLRKLFSNGAFVEGWAVYTERVMVEAGYSGVGPAEGSKRPKSTSKALWTVQTDPALRAKAIVLFGLKFYLRTVTNAILDHEIHAGSMSREQAIALMTEQSFQEQGEAEAKWTRAQVSSTQLSTYFVGAQAWFRLREAAEARPGFSLLEFHRQALAHGAPPVDRLPELMGW